MFILIININIFLIFSICFLFSELSEFNYVELFFVPTGVKVYFLLLKGWFLRQINKSKSYSFRKLLKKSTQYPKMPNKYARFVNAL